MFRNLHTADFVHCRWNSVSINGLIIKLRLKLSIKSAGTWWRQNAAFAFVGSEATQVVQFYIKAAHLRACSLSNIKMQTSLNIERTRFESKNYSGRISHSPKNGKKSEKGRFISVSILESYLFTCKNYTRFRSILCSVYEYRY